MQRTSLASCIQTHHLQQRLTGIKAVALSGGNTKAGVPVAEAGTENMKIKWLTRDCIALMVQLCWGWHANGVSGIMGNACKQSAFDKSYITAGNAYNYKLEIVHDRPM